jgi:D-beta-D-heptose 7-phosphate kinase/D-beta-D-heptose 1-phosphate adenosyltransferase
MRNFQAKIKSAKALQKTLALLKKKRGKIVFTNGTFDILHPGHVSYLAQARKLGTHLVVALNTDASVKRYKGPTRPVNSLEDRMLVMASLEAVDFVTSFDEDTPLELIRQLRPNILVKGGDWEVAKIVGAVDVLSWGGKVKSLPFVAGKSTTSILEKARV